MTYPYKRIWKNFQKVTISERVVLRRESSRGRCQPREWREREPGLSGRARARERERRWRAPLSGVWREMKYGKRPSARRRWRRNPQLTAAFSPPLLQSPSLPALADSIHVPPKWNYVSPALSQKLHLITFQNKFQFRRQWNFSSRNSTALALPLLPPKL